MNYPKRVARKNWAFICLLAAAPLAWAEGNHGDTPDFEPIDPGFRPGSSLYDKAAADLWGLLRRGGATKQEFNISRIRGIAVKNIDCQVRGEGYAYPEPVYSCTAKNAENGALIKLEGALAQRLIDYLAAAGARGVALGMNVRSYSAERIDCESRYRKIEPGDLIRNEPLDHAEDPIDSETRLRGNTCQIAVGYQSPYDLY